MKRSLLVGWIAMSSLAGCLEERPAGDDSAPPEAPAPPDDGPPGSADAAGEGEGEGEAPPPQLDDDGTPGSQDDGDDGPDLSAYGDAIAPLGDVRPTGAGGRRRPIHIMDLALVGDTAYLATYTGTLAVDLRDPGRPEQLGDPIGSKVYWLAPSDAGLLTAGRDDGLRLLRVGLDGQWDEQAGRSAETVTPEGVATEGERAYVAAQEQGLLVYELFDLRRLGAWTGVPNAVDVAVQSGVAYVADRERGLVIADVSDPAAIIERGAVELEGGLAQHVELSPDGGHVYVAAGATLGVVDVSAPEAPVLVAELRPEGVATAVAADGDLLALANWSDTRLYDVSVPAEPRLVSVEDSVDAAMSVDLRGDLLAVGDWDHIRTYRIDPGLQAPEIELDRSITVIGDPAETPLVEVFVVVGNRTSDPVDLEVFDVTCASPAVTPAMTEATVAPGLVAVFPIMVDLVAGGGRRPERGWRTSCAFWTTDPDERVVEVELVVNPDGLSVGDPAPDWTLPDLDGELHTLSAHRGKVVVMTIFSSL